MEDDAEDETEPADDSPLQYRDADGEWHDIEVAPKRTGDPELDALWAMSFRELRELLDDESHPLHAKAEQVSEEMLRPIRDAANQALKPLTDSFLKAVDTAKLSANLSANVMPKVDLKGLPPTLDKSWLSKMMPETPTFRWAETASPIEASPPPSILGEPRRAIDFESMDLPDATVVEIREAAEIRAHEMRTRQNELLADLVLEFRENSKSGARALEVSEEALEATKSSKRAGWTAAWAAVAAAVIAAVGIIVTVVVASL